MSGYINIPESGEPVGKNNPLPAVLSGSNVTLADAISTSGLKTAVPVGWYSLLRLNIYGTASTFNVQVQGQMYDGVWRTLPPADAITGADVTSNIATTGVYDFDVSGWQQVAINVVSVTGGNVSAKGALLP